MIVTYTFTPGIYFDRKIDANTLCRSKAGGNTNTIPLLSSSELPGQNYRRKQEGVYTGLFTPENGKV